MINSFANTLHFALHVLQKGILLVRLKGNNKNVANIYAVQHMLCHKQVETTQNYAAMNDETKRESVNRITLKAPEKKDDVEKD